MPDARPVVVLHIGAMKTGTTFLQQLMVTNREHLADAGYLFPGETWADQVRAANDALGKSRRDPRIKAAAAGAWPVMAAQMLAHRGPASVISVEFLSFAGTRRARRIVEGLAGADVRIVLTVRDATALVPAQWQTDVHNGAAVSWPDYLRGVVRTGRGTGRLGRLSPDRAVRSFSRAQDVPRMLRVWADLVPPGRMHVVTVPPAGSPPRLLWERFAEAAGVPADLCPELPGRDNSSLGYASSDLLRRTNARLGRLRPSEYDPTFKHYLALDVLARRRDEEPRAALDRRARDFALGWNAHVRDAIARSGVRVTGDLADLPVAPGDSDDPPEEVRPPEAAAVLDAATVAVDALERLVARRTRRLTEAGGRVDPVGTAPTTGVEQWRRAAEPLEAAATEVARLGLVAVDLQRRIRAAR
ncbi:MAG TPA: hypothetical protein VLA97_03475 [Nocardioidaceae bacterium]|nr:hypothetical protein [Nocardioidaceae bacterium]